MTNPNDQQAITLLADAFRRWHEQPFPITMSKRNAWILMGLCQLLHRHPLLEPELLTFVEQLGRKIQDNICDDPELYSLAETGWNPALDHVDPEEKQG